jgi:hypothetical protein
MGDADGNVKVPATMPTLEDMWNSFVAGALSGMAGHAEFSYLELRAAFYSGASIALELVSVILPPVDALQKEAAGWIQEQMVDGPGADHGVH